MQLLRVNDKPAQKISAKKIKEKGKAIIFDCECDKVWLPMSQIKILNDDEILITCWLYKQKFKS